ncbi:MAG: lipocalin family protein [Flavobacterium sp.]
MKKITALLSLVVLFACQPNVKPEDISKINGYWEIEKVILADGSEKTYQVNPTYDYIEIANNKGFRKKVTPQLNGKYLVDNLSEAIEVKNEGDKVYLNYKTPFVTFKEELKLVSEGKMVLVNEADCEYHYKKAELLNLDSNGEKAK